MLKRIKNITSIFHILIIASFLLGLHGCGYKADPYYEENNALSDKNVQFIIQKKRVDDNISKSCGQ